ncbi:MAG: MBL fold metallo-hydrolase [Planctomycetaceae bacterium]|nr:MBL fold metallo-hydrolase [Planctomycetaceae bacterium]
MRVQFLGTGGYHPNERRQTACIYLPDLGVVFDAGTAMFRLPSRLESNELTLFLSHAHLDHIAGLTYLLPAIGTGKLKKMTVYGTTPTLEAVRNHLFAKPVFPILPDFDFRALDEISEVHLPQGAVLTHHPLVSHPGGSTAYRIDWSGNDRTRGQSLAYVTDTTVDGTYTDFIRGVDLLIHECYFPDSYAELAETTGHSHTTPVARLASNAEVTRLLLVHVNPEDESDDPIGIARACSIFANTQIAEDGLTIRC